MSAIGRLSSASAVVLAIALCPLRGAAETRAPWTPNAQNQPGTCVNIWRDIGLPRYAPNVQRDTTLVCHKRFVLSHNNPYRAPDWVVEHLQKSTLSNAFDRPGVSFSQEERVPPNARMRDTDYPLDALGLARGHMAPSEDFNDVEEDMAASFVLSNAVPQVGDKFNGSIWRQLESEVRKATMRRDSLFVITGPIHGLQGRRTRTSPASVNACGNRFELQGPKQPRACAANKANADVLCGTAGEVVPVGLYKIIYDPGRKVAYAFIMPNKPHMSRTGPAGRAYLDDFRATVAVVERLTGLQFLRGIPVNQQNTVIRTCASDSLWPVPVVPQGAAASPVVEEEEDPALRPPPWLRQPQLPPP